MANNLLITTIAIIGVSNFSDVLDEPIIFAQVHAMLGMGITICPASDCSSEIKEGRSHYQAAYQCQSRQTIATP